MKEREQELYKKEKLRVGDAIWVKDKTAGGLAKKTKYLGEIVSRFDYGRVKVKF